MLAVRRLQLRDFKAGFEIAKLQSTNGEHSVRTLSELTNRDSQDWLDEAELLDAAVERAHGEAERAGGLLLVVQEARERTRDQIALGLIEGRNRLLEPPPPRVGPPREAPGD